jgi:hypothetical protein
LNSSDGLQEFARCHDLFLLKHRLDIAAGEYNTPLPAEQRQQHRDTLMRGLEARLARETPHGPLAPITLAQFGAFRIIEGDDSGRELCQFRGRSYMGKAAKSCNRNKWRALSHQN